MRYRGRRYGARTPRVNSAPASTPARWRSSADIDKIDVEIGVQVFDFDADLVNDVTANNGDVVAPSGTTVTICTQNTAFYAEDETMTLTSSVGQRTARIVATSTKLLCTAQVLDSENDPPTSIATLPIFSKLKQKGD